uniref:Amine oxidase domain-containing protein n=1 Tax=Capra hircus TaxID=9925 RepID=A0A8C2SFD1_CAPHI
MFSIIAFLEQVQSIDYSGDEVQVATADGTVCTAQKEVPDPTKYFVTRWSTDPWIQMAYSFVKTGGSGEAYDILAEEIQGTVFFAGEATNRHFPQTVTGAYLSGVREASKIAAF